MFSHMLKRMHWRPIIATRNRRELASCANVRLHYDCGLPSPSQDNALIVYSPYHRKLGKEQTCNRCLETYPFNMARSVEMVAEEALNLPTSGHALLVEKLLASLSGEANPALERAHLDDVRERRAAVRSGKARLVEGTEALRRARAALQKRITASLRKHWPDECGFPGV
jgi:hypothetical protein